MRGSAVAVMVAAWGVALGAGAGPGPAAVAATTAAGENRVAVIVDTGGQVKSVCVRFREESISGVEALQRAAVDPVLRAFAGKGAAVCSLCGTGCPGDESCLTCDADGRFWSYSRAPAGTSSLRASGVGASSTAVRDGDVEGWRWGLGGAPAFASVEQVCGQVAPTATSTMASTAPPPTSGTTAPPATTATTSSAPAAAPNRTTATSLRRGGSSPEGAPAVPATIAPSTAPASTTAPTSSAPDASILATSGRDDITAGAPPEDDGDGGWAGLAGFAAVLAGLLGWSAVARRRRQDSSARR